MNYRQWRAVASQILGLYLIVQGTLYLAAALAAFGVGLPDNSRRWAFVATPVLQALIAALAGFLLVRRAKDAIRLEEPAPDSQRDSTFALALQLLGVFFFVTGIAELLHLAIDTYFVGADWTFRTSQLASGAVKTVAGVILIVVPHRVARKLSDFSSAVHRPPPPY